ncbi:MAG: BRO family protein [Ghiorsea sp.]
MSISIVANTFKNTEVRAFEEGGLSWFVAADIAKALGYAAAKDMTRMLDDDEKGGRLVPTPSGDQKMNVINESGMYHALIKSRKPEAKPFRKWVTGEVLPSIRKTGSYTLPQTITPKQKLEIREAIAAKVYANYPEGKRQLAFSAEYKALYKAFGISKYDELPENRFGDAMLFILGDYEPPVEALTLDDDHIAFSKSNHAAAKQLVEMLQKQHDTFADLQAKADSAEDAAREANKALRTFKTATHDIVKDLAFTLH